MDSFYVQIECVGPPKVSTTPTSARCRAGVQRPNSCGSACQLHRRKTRGTLTHCSD